MTEQDRTPAQEGASDEQIKANDAETDRLAAEPDAERVGDQQAEQQAAEGTTRTQESEDFLAQTQVGPNGPEGGATAVAGVGQTGSAVAAPVGPGEGSPAPMTEEQAEEVGDDPERVAGHDVGTTGAADVERL